MNNVLRCSAILICLAVPAFVPAALESYLDLQANGEAIEGEANKAGFENQIEVESFAWKISQSYDPTTGSTGRPTFTGITITKTMDKSDPLIMNALYLGQSIDGTFTFPYQAQSGELATLYTVEMLRGRVTSVEVLSPDATDPDTAEEQMKSKITFQFETIVFSHEPSGQAFEGSQGPDPARGGESMSIK